MPRLHLAPARMPTMYFVGVTTGRSMIMKVFPLRVEALGLGRCELKGIDPPQHDEPERCREVIRFIRDGPQVVGALVTTHAIDLLRQAGHERAGKWERRSGSELEGKTLGILGCGRIGQLVVRYGLALEMQVAAYDVDPQSGFSPGAGFRRLSAPEVPAASDVLSLYCPHVAGEAPSWERPPCAA